METPANTHLFTKIDRGIGDRVTTQDILRHHEGTGLIPHTRKIWRSMLAETYLILLEMLAYGESLEAKNLMHNDGWREMMTTVVGAVKKYLSETGYWDSQR